MDVTPQLVEQVEFADKFRGYDPDQVDDFLERVGVALAGLTEQLRQATERAERAESQLSDAGSGAPQQVRSEEQEAEKMARTLLLAQKAADQAVEEANAAAEQTLSEARAAGEKLRSEAQHEADRLLSDARAEHDALTRRAREEAEEEVAEQRRQLIEQIEELETIRDGLMKDVDLLEGHLDVYRSSLQSTIDGIQSILENPESSAPSEAPLLSDIKSPAVRDELRGLPEPPPVEIPPRDDLAPQPEPLGPSAVFKSPLGPSPVAEKDTEPGPSIFGAPPVGGDDSEWGPGSWSRVDEDSGAQPPSVPEVPAFAPLAGTAGPDDVEAPESVSPDDRFLKELSEAVNADAPKTSDDAEADAAMAAFFESDEDETPQRRRGRRK